MTNERRVLDLRFCRDDAHAVAAKSSSGNRLGAGCVQPDDGEARPMLNTTLRVGLIVASVVGATGCASGKQVSSLSEPSPGVTNGTVASVLTDATAPSSNSSADPQPRATALCERVFGADIGGAPPVTVGVVRTWTVGPPVLSPSTSVGPFAAAFAGVPDREFAAFCWVGGAGSWKSWAVDNEGTRVDMGVQLSAATPQPGGPGLP